MGPRVNSETFGGCNNSISGKSTANAAPIPVRLEREWDRDRFSTGVSTAATSNVPVKLSNRPSTSLRQPNISAQAASSRSKNSNSTGAQHSSALLSAQKDNTSFSSSSINSAPSSSLRSSSASHQQSRSNNRPVAQPSSLPSAVKGLNNNNNNNNNNNSNGSASFSQQQQQPKFRPSQLVLDLRSTSVSSTYSEMTPAPKATKTISQHSHEQYHSSSANTAPRTYSSMSTLNSNYSAPLSGNNTVHVPKPAKAAQVISPFSFHRPVPVQMPSAKSLVGHQSIIPSTRGRDNSRWINGTQVQDSGIFNSIN
jgi:hypothetical protein